jgi:hypothetical protein
MSAARQGYAQARVQARYSTRPAPHDFSVIDASRSVAHLHEALRHGPFAPFVATAGPASDSDAFEAGLRRTWRGACAEVARWHEPTWMPAFIAFRAHADLASLALLRAGMFVPSWLRNDEFLGPIARSEAELRATLLRGTYGVDIATAFAADAPLADGWRSAWRGSWPGQHPGIARQLAEVAEVHADTGESDESRLSARTGRLERVFRRAAGTPAAGFAYLGLVGITLQRIRGGRAALLVAEAESP